MAEETKTEEEIKTEEEAVKVAQAAEAEEVKAEEEEEAAMEASFADSEGEIETDEEISPEKPEAAEEPELDPDEAEKKEEKEEKSDAGKGDEPVDGEKPEEEKPAGDEPVEEPDAKPLLFAGKTEEEIQSLFDKADQIETLRTKLQTLNRNLSGKIGGLEQLVKAIPKMHPEAKEKLATEFPEMRTILFGKDDDAGGEAPAVETPSEPASAEPNEEPEQPVYTPDQKLEMRLVELNHPGWEDTMRTPRYGEWFNAQPAEKKEAIRDSWDANYMISQFNEFNDWDAAEKKEATVTAEKETAEAKKAATKKAEDEKLKKRLGAAAHVEGVGGLPDLPSDNDEAAAMEAAFKKP